VDGNKAACVDEIIGMSKQAVIQPLDGQNGLLFYLNE
jgi:hypothetical protein